MIDLTAMHMKTLRQIADQGLVDATCIVAELAGAGYIKRNRYRLGEGWQYDLTERGRKLLSPMPPIRGNTRRLAEAEATWMD